MTLKDTGTVMEILKTAYPTFYSGPNAPDLKQATRLWAEMFRDDDVSIVAAAVKALIVTDEKGFPPHIGAVKGKIRQVTAPDQMTEMEAWELVRKALSRSGYGAEEEYKKLPPMIQRLVGSHRQLKEWAMMDTDTVNSVIASNFQRSYRARAKSEANYMALPKDIRSVIEGVANHMELPEKNSDKMKG